MNMLFAVSSGGSIVYNEVKMILVKQPNFSQKYKTITTNLNKTISLSANHLIYARVSGTSKFHQM